MVSSASFSSLSGVRQHCLGLYACLRKVSGRSIGAPPVNTFKLSIDEESSSSFFVSLSLSLSLCVCLSFSSALLRRLSVEAWMRRCLRGES
jgi:hypothetical protein